MIIFNREKELKKFMEAAEKNLEFIKKDAENKNIKAVFNPKVVAKKSALVICGASGASAATSNDSNSGIIILIIIILAILSIIYIIYKEQKE